ncbi:MAG TPA: OmpA family protein [Planctomycetota bacterium]|nr:OmpA family protein [Planctomycetota bacterium]
MRLAKLVTGLFSAAVLGACTHTEAYRDAKTEIDNQDSVIRRQRGELEACMAERDLLRARAEAAELEARRLRDLEATYRQASAGLSDLEARLKELDGKYGALDSDINLKWDPRGAKYEVAESLLFDPGKSDLKASGKKALKTLADRLAERDEMLIVEGHTDDDPVSRSIKENPLGNLELSGKRALKVAHFLTHEGGVNAERVSFAGFGEHKPLVPNDSKAGKAKNRRVEIIIVRKPDGK